MLSMIVQSNHSSQEFGPVALVHQIEETVKFLCESIALWPSRWNGSAFPSSRIVQGLRDHASELSTGVAPCHGWYLMFCIKA